jgi:hypothetical protein
VSLAVACSHPDPRPADPRPTAIAAREAGAPAIALALAQSDAGPIDASLDAAPLDVRTRLGAWRVADDNWAQRTVYSWTTQEQVDALRASHVLLVATATTRGPPSPFVFLIDPLSRLQNPTGALAKLLASDARFTKRRYAWRAAYATVLGLATHRYGNQLVGIALRPDAWIVSLDPSRAPALHVRDLEQHEVAIADALAHPERIAAVYHVRSGTDVPVPFREYVLVNETAIERWAIGTPDVRAEVSAETTLLRDLRGELARDAGTLAPQWKATMAFENARYRTLDAPHLDAILAGLGDYDAAQPELIVQAK